MSRIQQKSKIRKIFVNFKYLQERIIIIAKKSFYRKKLSKLRSTNPRQWFKWIKGVGNSEQNDEKLEVESIKHLSDIEQAELIADKFAEVSNEYQPLDRSKINFPHFKDEIPEFEEKEVFEVLQDLKINKSSQPTDVPARIFKAYAQKLYKPMTKVINTAVKTGIWPDFLKMEIVTPVLKVSQPKCIDDLRNISGLMNMNKVMEKLICKLIISDMKDKMDASQFANQKGVSDHYLIKMIDKVLNDLDKKGEYSCDCYISRLVKSLPKT